MIWLVMAVAVTVGLAWGLIWREEARWRRFRQVHGEPEVFAKKIAAKADRTTLVLLGLIVVSSAVDQCDPETAGRDPVPPAITA